MGLAVHRGDRAVPDTVIVASFLALLSAFRDCFTAPTFRNFCTLCAGWLLAIREHAVTSAVRAADAVSMHHISAFHRFFSRARWSADDIGLVLLKLIDTRLPDDSKLTAVLDDTLGRHTGKTIANASMHRDPLLSTKRRPVFHWGHLWVIFGVNIEAFGKTWCLPVFVRLYRGPKVCAARGLPYRTVAELGAELVLKAANALPHRQVIVIGDNAYTNKTLVRPILRDAGGKVTFIGRARSNAILYEPPPPRRPSQMGRPRVRGARLPSPKEAAARPGAHWRRVDAHVYRHHVIVRVLVIDALWYTVTHGALARLIVVRGFPGHDDDDVFLSTDPMLDPVTIIETYSRRWPIEVTIHEAKGRLGFEAPRNRTDLAVQRTAPVALWLYSLLVIWYLDVGQRLRTALVPNPPWYTRKTAPAFSDMLATLRRAMWAQRLLAPNGGEPIPQKQAAAIVEYLDAVA
jgi:hypothetical protein